MASAFASLAAWFVALASGSKFSETSEKPRVKWHPSTRVSRSDGVRSTSSAS